MLVMPAQAGIHKHRRMPSRESVFMDPRLRGGDEVDCVYRAHPGNAAGAGLKPAPTDILNR
mgnify:CR=1 FL=1